MAVALARMTILAGAVMLASPAGGVDGSDRARLAAPMEVTSDTAAYCTQLAVRIGGHAEMGADLARLAAEGKRMCEDGRVRAGVGRLRRVLMLLDGT